MAEKVVQTRKSTLLPDATTGMLEVLMRSLPALLPTDINATQFRAALWLELTRLPGLAQCGINSIKECAIKAATYGLLPGRDCHFLPFTIKGQKQATFVENYFGVLLTLDRTGKVKTAFAHPVYSGDTFVCDHLAGLYSHVPACTLTPPRPEGKLRFFYACIVVTGGEKHVEVMTLDEIDAIRKRAPAHDSSPWVTDYNEMAKKTVLKRAAKYVKGAPHLQQLLEEAEARERTDIPEARQLDNMAALYNMDPGTPTDPDRVRASRQTGEIVDIDQMPFDILASHALDQELAEKEQ